MRKATEKGKKREEKINSQEPRAKAEPRAETERHLRLCTQRNEDQKNGELENSETRRYLETSWVLVVNVFILTIANSLGLGHQNQCSLPLEMLTNSPMMGLAITLLFIFEMKAYFINEL